MLLPRPIPAFQDNYIWMLIEPNSANSLVVDPGDAAPVLEILKQENLTLTRILLTHHHLDHTGGVLELMNKTGASVHGPNAQLFKEAQALRDGDNISLPELSLEFSVLEIPGHTLDHIAFLSSSSIMGNRILFCGDTLFTGGCGRVFEGTPAQMLATLKKLKGLDEKTLIYCGHEYTEANLKFARIVEPENDDLSKRSETVMLMRRSNQVTVPSTLEIEFNTNPFLRTECESVRQAVEAYAGHPLGSEEEVFTKIRKWKNDFS